MEIHHADIDIRPAAAQMADVLANVPDDAVEGRRRVRPSAGPAHRPRHRLRAGVHALGAKELGPMTATPPKPDDADLEPGWQQRAAAHLRRSARRGRPTMRGRHDTSRGVDLPGAVAGRIVLDELVVHCWDVARATGQPFEPDDGYVAEVEATVTQFRGDNTGEVPGLFGPTVAVRATPRPSSAYSASPVETTTWSP